MEKIEQINQSIEEYQMMMNYEDIEDIRMIRCEIQELKNEKHRILKTLKKENIRA